MVYLKEKGYLQPMSEEKPMQRSEIEGFREKI
jgi:hypothetical protein